METRLDIVQPLAPETVAECREELTRIFGAVEGFEVSPSPGIIYAFGDELERAGAPTFGSIRAAVANLRSLEGQFYRNPDRLRLEERLRPGKDAFVGHKVFLSVKDQRRSDYEFRIMSEKDRVRKVAGLPTKAGMSRPRNAPVYHVELARIADMGHDLSSGERILKTEFSIESQPHFLPFGELQPI